MRWNIILLFFSFVILASVELGLHWYMGSGSDPLATQLRDWYVYQDPDSHKRVLQGLVTFVIPSVLMGSVIGSLGATWSPRKLALTVLMLSAGIIILFRICIKFLGADVFSPNYSLASIVVPVVTLCGGFAYFAKVLTVFLVEGRDITTD